MVDKTSGEILTMKRYFTLIELMVVIAIIGILVTILMPSLSEAREKAKRALCMSNSKNIAAAMVMFTQDNNDKFPYKLGGTMYSFTGKWTATRQFGSDIRPVNKYLGEYEERAPVPVAHCPSGDYGYEKWGTSYGSNSFTGAIKGINNNDYTGRRITEIANPTRLVQFAETGAFHPGWNLRVVPVDELTHSSQKKSHFVLTIVDGHVISRAVKVGQNSNDEFTFDDRN